jgi:hypothetical protein
VLGALASLAVRLKTEAGRFQQLSHFPVAYFKAFRLERACQYTNALAGPSQRGLRITARIWVHQSIEGCHQSGLPVGARFPAATRSPLAIWWERIRIVEFADPVANSAIRNPRGDRDSRDSASSQRQRFTGGPTSPSSLIQVLSDVGELPSNPFDDVCLRHRPIMPVFRNSYYRTFGSLLFHNA